ncbi:enoyl-ACP reductase FabI [Thermus thermophilus]|uniref:Enoyl-[acyl-carrier-protein] reductase [NADH] n=1 Tax=Thermus thermophilus JL-18 TaxID=798128 RepID=H9ZNU0_THETH|nr:enoyl-ACP reductase [Thermus thermophilus]AFH38000.1 enoyl-(acyl-carrier-protein) reductase (NADH) [Thermus thermophilus JL-18]
MLTLDLSGKKALVMGVTNQRSLGYAIAEKLHQAGAELAFSYQGERLREEVERLAAPLKALTFQADVTQDEELDRLFAGIQEAWGELDYLVHAIAFAPREAMEGRYLDTKRQDWLLALEVSAYSLVAVAQRAEPLLREGGGIVTLTYYASEKVVPKYNVMAIAKAALEASVRYLAYELGPKGVRVNAISAGPVRTVAARSIPGFTKMYDRVAQTAPLRRNITQEEVGNLGLFLLSPLASGITGEVVYVDAGYHIMGMELEG